MAAPHPVTITDGSQSKQVFFYPGIPVEDVQRNLSAAFGFVNSCIGFQRGDGTTVPVSLVCEDPSSFTNTALVPILSDEVSNHSKKKKKRKRKNKSKSEKKVKKRKNSMISTCATVKLVLQILQKALLMRKQRWAVCLLKLRSLRHSCRN